MNIYLGLFVVAFSALALEITLVRLLSITTWYHLSFFAISTALLGMTAGATRVYLQPQRFTPERLPTELAGAAVRLAVSVPVTLVLLCLVPLALHRSVMFVLALALTTAACALPFYFTGTIVSAVLTKYDLPMGRLYASDLVGASLGCLFVLGGLELLDAPSLILLCGAAGAVAGLVFLGRGPRTRRRDLLAGLAVVLAVAALLNARTTRGIRPLVVKGERIESATTYEIERWNSFSRVAVYPQTHEAPWYWGPSPHAPMDPVHRHFMNIDGEAGTAVGRFAGPADIDYLRWDVTNVAYHLGRGGPACVIGVGGGRDIQSALLFGHDQVTGIEVNPIFIDLLENEFRDFAGLADRPDVELVRAEARSWLSRTPREFSVLQMSLIDTWAATGAGAFSLSENALYTVEAWSVFLDRLAAGGVFTVSRWHSPGRIGETGRVLSLATATLLRRGVQEPGRHMMLVSAGNISTLLLAREPFAPMDMIRMEEICADYGFELLLAPGQPPREPRLAAILAARTHGELLAATRGGELNLSPTTDENPYFFNMLRLRHLGAARDGPAGVVHGNLNATLTLGGLLLTLLVFALATIVVPLARGRTSAGDTAPVLRSGAVYFSLIGAGFMLAEIALIQRLTVLLSHPVQALGILLFTIILSTGLGSLLSDRLPLRRAPWLQLLPVVTALAVLAVRFLLTIVLRETITADLPVKIAASVAVVFPLGLLMGMFFPTGMVLAKSVRAADTPWYWALNGVFGVLFAAVAVFVSIYAGVSVNFYLAAACYAAVVVPAVLLLRRARPAAATGREDTP